MDQRVPIRIVTDVDDVRVRPGVTGFLDIERSQTGVTFRLILLRRGEQQDFTTRSPWQYIPPMDGCPAVEIVAGVDNFFALFTHAGQRWEICIPPGRVECMLYSPMPGMNGRQDHARTSREVEWHEQEMFNFMGMAGLPAA